MGAAAYLAEAFSFRAGFMADPIGPGAFPVGIGALLLALASVLVLRGSKASKLDRPFLGRAAVLLTGLGGFTLALDIVGFVIASTLVMTLAVIVFEGPLLRGLIASFFVSLGLFALFVYGFAVPLPLGSFFQPS